jgi:hypothetical protein
MSCPRKYVLFVGLKSVVSGRPTSAFTFPPTISVRPSASWMWPAQKRFRAYGTGTNVPVAGSQIFSEFGASSHASNASTFPVGSSDMWTATSGHATGALHAPTWALVTAARVPPSCTSASANTNPSSASRRHEVPRHAVRV